MKQLSLFVPLSVVALRTPVPLRERSPMVIEAQPTWLY
jgi:hypothetical protein